MQIDDELLQTLNKTYVTSYGIDVERTNAIDIMQQKVSFCYLLVFFLILLRNNFFYKSNTL